MAATETSSAGPQKISSLITTLVSAFLEWLLIFLLFIDAVFSYVITKFARGCKLQTPCLICSRLDHVLGKEKKGYCWDLMCRDHKSEISSLVLCHAHNKLVDVHKMCESCLFSFATINKSNAETYRLLVGKLGEDINSDFDQDPLLGDHRISSLSTKHCACCNQPWVPRGHAQELIRSKLVGSEAAELETPLSGAMEHNQDIIKKERSSVSITAIHSRNGGLDPLSHVQYTELNITSDTESEPTEENQNLIKKERSSVSVTASHSRSGGLDPLSHIGYTELKITSDSESEAFSDDDEGASALIRETHDYKDEFSVQCIEPSIVTLDGVVASDKLIDSASGPKPSLLVSEVQVDAIESFDYKSQESAIAIGHGLEELNWQQVEDNANIPGQTKVPLSAAPSTHTVGTPVEVSKSCDITRTDQVGDASLAECGKVFKEGVTPSTTSESGLERNPVASDYGQQLSNLLDLGDAYKLAVGNRGKQLSGLLAEQWIGKDSSRVSEDLKLLLSQLSVTRGTEQPMNEISPKLSVNSDDLKTSDSSNSIGIQILQKRISLERNESGLSLDGSIVSEIEGETVVDRLKRQVEHDKKLMTALYRELEEERNASAIATNQAMAMITRLQEEKAALHMEALQYLRMMEEQAEYDNDELQKSNDLLAEKEKEIQDLEAELELYRKKFPDERVLEILGETSCDMITDIGVDNSKYSCSGERPYNYNKVEDAGNSFENTDVDNLNSSILDFEDEKTYILQCLKKLEKALYQLPDGEVSTYLSKDNNLKNRTCGLSQSDEHSEVEVNILSMQHDESVSRQDLQSEGNSFSFENPELHGRETGEVYCSRQSAAELSQATDSASLGIIVSGLTKRLEALEADRKFLEHTINSLRNGDEGVQFIHEIASHLRELRRIAIRKDQTVS
ncbi:Zein-binding domain containing protein [Trema orientale]|uniref:Zein-binding domain containing protein n=1 Tax=Trema orientale TaxID=63057 RepID=A0A2P5DJH5_TREOI|nr:Zein-binding domain containing protein [Trema orientale]